MSPAARYAKSGDVHIAYVTYGDAPLDIVWVPTWISHCEYLWAEPTLRAALERIASFARIIMFDRRGSGLSDPMVAAPTLEEQMDDVIAVLDAAGSDRAAILSNLEGGPMGSLFAATHPDRTKALVLYGTFARATAAPGYDWAWTEEQREARMAEANAVWGQGYLASGIAASRQGDREFMDWAARLERLAASPTTIRRITEVIGGMDVRDVLPSIRVPTLVMHRRDDTFIDVRHSRYIAEHIPGARYVELEGTDHLFSVGDSEAFLGELEEFLTGERHVPEPDRVLATVLFTDICDSTKRASELGDQGWRELLARHDSLMRRAIERHRGREVKQLGDGFLATFDGPARGIRAAASAAEAARTLGIEVRAGLHTGECEVIGDDLGGMAVHIAARVMASAGPGEVLVSGTVKDLVVGSGLGFEDRGRHELRGVPGDWQLFALG